VISKILFFLLMASLSFAGEVASSSKTLSSGKQLNAPSQPTELGNCDPLLPATRKDPNDSNSPLVAQDPRANNDPNLTPEAYAKREAMKADLGKEEILARLIFAESLSSGYWNNKCNATSEEIVMTSIGWGIMNRVRQKARNSLDPYADVIFANKQFTTSFSKTYNVPSSKEKKENPFSIIFLCPLKALTYLSKAQKNAPVATLYAEAQKTARSLITSYETNSFPDDYKVVTNFWYPRSEHNNTRPAWAPNESPNLNPGYLAGLSAKQNPCIEFYNLKGK